MRTWRLATREDEPAIVALLIEQEKKIGYALDYPDLFDRPVLRAEVCEEDGKIIGCVYFEANVEVVTIAVDKEFSKEVVQEAPRWAELFRGLGFRIARAFVPKRFGKAMSRFIKRTWARNLDDELSHFMFDLRG